MKQIIIISCLALNVLASFEHHQYAPQHQLGLIDLGEHIDLKNTHYKAEYPPGLLFGHGFISGLEHHSDGDSLKGYGSGPGDYSISQNIASHFEENLVSAELPKIIPEIKTSIAPVQQIQPQKIIPRLTKTATATYEVNENTYDPVPIPKITIPMAILPKQNPIQIGSGSLGVVDLGQGKFAVGSGTLGYGQAQEKPASGGIQVVAAPQFKTPETYAARAAPIEQSYQDLGSFEDADFSSFFKS